MIRQFFIVAILIGFFSSCSTDDDLQIKKSGRFLSKIFQNDEVIEQYFYDKNGYLTEIDRFNYHGNDTNKMFFECNSLGLVQKWMYTDALNNPLHFEIFEYDSTRRLVKRTAFLKDFDNPDKTEYIKSNMTTAFSYSENILRVEDYYSFYYNDYRKTDNYFEYEFDRHTGNINVVRYYSNNTLRNIDMYAYDDKINPIRNLNLPIPLNSLIFFNEVSFLSQNNIRKVNSIMINTEDANIDSAFSYTYDIQYQYDSLGYPVYLCKYNRCFRFEYIDIK
jgi:hypothetical protein